MKKQANAIGSRTLRLSKEDAIILFGAIEAGADILRAIAPKKQWEALRRVCAKYRVTFDIKG